MLMFAMKLFLLAAVLDAAFSALGMSALMEHTSQQKVPCGSEWSDRCVIGG